MNGWPGICSAALALLLLPGCNRVADRNVATDPHPSDEASVSFDLEPLPSGDGSRQWRGIYNSPGKIARFRIDLGAPESKSGEGTLLPEPGSDSSVLLADVQRVLRARTAPKAPQTKTSVPFTYRNLGDHLSHAPGGGFNATPAGDWTALRLIFGDSDRESEIFLHINDNAKKGQFSMTDPRYGDFALAELAKVL
ncbi:MAG: hypothetical protein ABJF23_15700 [Bryobacteraceae bacterium]